MFRGLLNEGQHDKTQELICNEKGHNRLGHGELWLLHILLAISIPMLVHLNHFIKETVLATGLVDYVKGECNDQCNRGSLADAENVILEFALCELLMEHLKAWEVRYDLGLEGRVECAGDQETKGGNEQKSSSNL
ncbi:hypothetical protein HG530_000485 [Fusarium avenaceum]|nr:hypothetical protein HG530_000485 [Fusarium avenaceum]